jgi:hypothetical protein
MKQYNLKYAKQGGAEVSAVTGELMPVEMQWQPNKVLSTSKNIVAGTLSPTPPDFDTKALRKTPQLCGPIKEATCGPFIIAYGTSGTPEANLANKRYADRFAKEWFEFTRSRPVLKADKDVTDAEKTSKNIFIVGEEQDNLIHKLAALKLPFAVKDGNATIGDKTVKLAGKGLMYIYPSPLAPPNSGRYVVVCTGVNYGQSIGANHKFDLLPDFLLFADEADTDSTGTNKAWCAGFFDGQWKLDPKLTWWKDK